MARGKARPQGQGPGRRAASSGSKPRAAQRVLPALRPLLVPVGSLHADPANLRTHGTESLEAIAASLARWGQQKPIVVDDDGVIIAGNGTYAAAVALGWKEVAAIRSDLCGVDRVAYAIADNRIPQLAGWDQAALASTLRAMSPADLAVTGFDADSIEMLQAAPPTTQDQVPEPPTKPVAQRGDVWTLGAHRLVCGDCTDAAVLRNLMGQERACLFATDPPYLVDYDGTNHPQHFANGGNKDWSGTYGKSWDDADANSDLYDRFIAAAVAGAITEQAAWYCWHASRRQAMLEAAWIKHGAFVHCQIIWAKNKPVLTRTWYLWQHEPCLFGWRRKPKRCDRQCVSTVWNLDTIPNGPERPDHPTPKPIEVFAIPMRQHTAAGDLCFEPFSGSGSQIIAAEQLGRRCYACEIEPAYIDVAIARWQKLTGKNATLGRQTFAAVAAARKGKKR